MLSETLDHSPDGGDPPAPPPGGKPMTIDEALARALFVQSPHSMVIYDARGRVEALNPAFERMWGVNVDSVPPGYTVLADPELEKAGFLPLIRRAFDGEVVVTPPVRYDISRVSATAAGEAIWTQGHFYPVLDARGRLTHVVLTHLDISEQKRTEEALAVQAERLRLAQRAAHIGTFDWHIPTGRVTWTEVEERLFGLEPGEFDGTIQGWERMVHPDDLRPMHEAMSGAMRRGEREMEFAFRIRRPDGEVRSILGNAEILYAPDGSPLRMVGVNVDVTDRLRAEEQRQRTLALLRETEEIARVGSWEWDLVEQRLTWSDEMYRVYGLDPRTEPISYERYLELMPPEDRERTAARVQRALEDGLPFAFDHRIIRSDGQVRYVHGRGRVVLDAGGNPVRMVGSGQDITERKAAEEELRRAKEEAEAANRAKSEFLAVMSHELRTPLNAIGGYAQLIDLGIHGPVTGAQQDALQRIQQSQKHLLGLINDVLNYARLEAGTLSYEMSAVPVAEVLAAAEAVMSPQVAAHGLRLHVEPPAPEATVRADREKLQQILLNLLSNAVKFTLEGGTVSLGTAERGEEVEIRVSDTGIGIPAEKLESIFEPFVQVGRSLSNPTEGAGLGLAISRDLARGMGGELAAESRVGRGSTFSLRLHRGEP